MNAARFERRDPLVSKKSSYLLIAAVLLVAAFLAFGGGSWLWHLFLKMHGMPAAHH